MLWGDLYKKEFKIDPHNSCVANQIVKGKQIIVIWHVDDSKIPYTSPKDMSKFLVLILQ